MHLSGKSLDRKPRQVGILIGAWLAYGNAAGAPLADAQEEPEFPSLSAVSPRGATLFSEHCAMCHEHPKGNIPPVFVLGYQTPETVIRALTSGVMKPMAAGLSPEDIRAIAVHLTHREPGTTPEPDLGANICDKPAAPLHPRLRDWNGVGRSIGNTRFQPEPGISTTDVPRLKVKWAFAYPGGTAYGQPVVIGDRLFLTSVTGDIFSLSAKSGCTYWTWKADAAVRTAISVGAIAPSDSTRDEGFAAYFGDERGSVYAIDAQTGKKLWKTRIEEHPTARIVGSPVLYKDVLYVPTSSMDEGSAYDPSFPCCVFQGKVVALDARTGVVRWKTSMIPRPAVALNRTNPAGTPLSGPAGAAIWAAPTVDERRGLLYVATGNAYGMAEMGDTNSVVALDLATGQRRWAVQPTPQDDVYTRCKLGSKKDCDALALEPKEYGQNVPERMEFGSSPVLGHRPGGKDIIIVGQKSAVVYALDPDKGGHVLWEARVGVGGNLGGVMYGPAVDERAVYVSVADRTARPAGGLSAINLADGRRLWRTQPSKAVCSWGSADCSAAQPGAVTAMPDIVFSGSLDGHIRAYASRTGAIVWDFDTAQPFDAINGVKAVGGSVNAYAQIVADGVLYVNSGASLLSHTGNVLLAFTVDGK